MSRYVFARYLPGLVGETRRVCHVIALLDDDTVPRTLTALCGQSFPPCVLEQMPAWAGMPCEMCVLHTPTRPQVGHESRAADRG